MQTERNKELTKIGVVVKTPDHVYLQYYDFTKYCSDCKQQRVVFDWGFMSLTFTYNFGTGSGGSLSVSNFTFNFNQAQTTGINIFGMTKRNGVWHGNRMAFEE